MSLLSFTPADQLKAFVYRGCIDVVCLSKTTFPQSKNKEICAFTELIWALITLFQVHYCHMQANYSEA